MKYIFFLISIFCSLSTWASQNDSVYVGGRIVDAVSLRPKADAEIVATDSGNVHRVTTKTIDWPKFYGIPNDDGEELITYSLGLPHPGKWTLTIRLKGYDDQISLLNIPAKQYGRKVSTYDNDDIKIYRQVQKLKEVTVVASKVKMVMHGDTLIYNADAFQLEDGSLLDKLIKQLPGTKLENDGRIYVNGEFVSSLLIDGKDFFSGDANMALRNLPAYLVKNVKVYHKAADYAYLQQRDSIEKKGDPLVMDVNLKKNYHDQWVANLEAGGGTRNYYRGKGFAMRSNDILRVTLVGNANNMGDDRDLSDNEGWSLDELTTVPSKIQRGGADVLWQDRESDSYITSNVQVAKEDKDVWNTQHSINYIADNNPVATRLRNDERDKARSLWWNNNFVLPLKKLYLEAQFHTNIEHNRNSNISRSTVYNNYDLTDDILDRLTFPSDTLINIYRQALLAKQRTFDMGLGVLGKFKSPLTGNLITLQTNGTYAKTHDHGYDYALLQSTEGTDERLLSRRNPDRTTHIGASVDYEVRLRKWKMNLSYDLGRDVRVTERRLLLLEDKLDEAVASHWNMTDLDNLASSWAPDNTNSYWYKETAWMHTVKGKIEYSTNGNHFLLSLPLQNKRYTANDTRLSQIVRKSFLFLTPSLTWLSPKGIQFVYKMDVRQPNVTNLLDLTDTSNPQYVYKGNTGLKNEIEHQVKLNYSGRKKKGMQTYNMSLAWNISPLRIVNATVLNPKTGVYTITPHNISGTWNSTLTMSYSRAMDKGQHLFLDVDGNGTVGNYASYSAFTAEGSTLQRSSVTFQEYLANAKLRWQKSNFSASFKLGGHYTAARQHYTDAYINDGGDVSYTLNAQYLMSWKTIIESALAVLTHYGYTDPMMNKTNWVMNAAISQPLIKNKLTMRLVAFDLFHEIKNYRRTFENNVWQETTRNTLSNYFMLSLVYRFNKEPKNAP
ncbi:MAG TPA: hypothetical protein DIS88_06640 [Prevotella sp.]|nr:hypothetical protein [Prevotella sp.]